MGCRLSARRHDLPIRLSDLTKTPVNFDDEHEPNHVVIQATEDELFKCPFLMMSEFGGAFITPEEAAALRSYLQKGGFLWVDDAGEMTRGSTGFSSFAKCCRRARTRYSTCR